jgi:hypothetical protein
MSCVYFWLSAQYRKHPKSSAAAELPRKNSAAHARRALSPMYSAPYVMRPLNAEAVEGSFG